MPGSTRVPRCQGLVTTESGKGWAIPSNCAPHEVVMNTPRSRPIVVFSPLCLAGCGAVPTRDFIQDDDINPRPTAAKGTADIRQTAAAEEPEKPAEPPKLPPTRTLPQAIRAYCVLMRSPRPPVDAPKDGTRANQKYAA